MLKLGTELEHTAQVSEKLSFIVQRKPLHNDAPQNTGTYRRWLLKTASRQISFPSLRRSLAEFAMFAGVFIAASKVSLQLPYSEMLVPMLSVVILMMASMVASGVFRDDITNCIINLYVHSAYGFLLAAILLLPTCLLYTSPSPRDQA